MVDIDERVVSMKFDSSDFEKNTKSTMSILDKLHEKLSFKDAGSSDSLNAIADNVQKVADKAYTIVDRMIDKIKDNIANKLVNFLQENTVGQLKAGWDKYADMTTSVATLKAQGYEMSKITEQLERLNYFTDETSFEFTKMVGEIGKFTASGQSLEDATTAMMGIAEWAALSGKNAQEASRAMYQLSQALGAGQMRLVDWKSIQNLNMDTKEFRENAIEAAIAVGTLKDNLDGTYTTLVGKKAGSLSFNIREFSDKLTEGAWFTTEVMMEVYSKYSEAVDEIRDIYESEVFTNAQGESMQINTTAEAVKEIKKNNEYLVSQFKEKQLSSKDVSKLLSKWKQVEKVTQETVANYADINGITKEQAQEEMSKNYAEYLQEYATVFADAEKTAEEALDEWHTYVSEYGIKAFNASQEAKTFTEAIESAKDAASTVWTTIYTTVFGNYEQAKEIWTDLANALYEIFVDRLWDLNDVFTYWASGGASALESELDTYQKELDKIKKSGDMTQGAQDRMRFLTSEINELEKQLDTIIVDGEETTKTALAGVIKGYQDEINSMKANADMVPIDKERMAYLQKEINRLEEQMENSIFINGRTRMFQGIYAFGAGLKSIIFNFRDAWDSVTEDNAGGKALLAFSERVRNDGFRFYTMMKELGETDFYTDIAQGIKNLFAPFKGAIEVIKGVIGFFLPLKKSATEILLTLSGGFKNLTSKLVPSEETLTKIARILRGLVSVIRLIGKAIYAVWITFVKPILDVVFDAAGTIFDTLLGLVADLSDAFFGFEKNLEPLEALYFLADALKGIFGWLWTAIKAVADVLWDVLKPVVGFVLNLVRELFGKIRGLVGGGAGNAMNKIGTGIKNIGQRAKTAWKSTESFASIFDRFKNGQGIGNVLEMLGEMFDNLVTRIGRTTAALFGFEDAITEGKAATAFEGVKDFLMKVFTVIKWIYTNVIRPTLKTLIVGTANMLGEIGDAWRSGDILKILEILTKSFKALGSLQLFKVLQALSRTFGSTGILRVLRNGAKALKSLSRWLGAKAVNEVSTAIMKLVVAFGLLLAVLTAMSFLPTENLEKVSDMLIYAGIALGVMMVAMTTLSIVATKTRWGLVGIAGSMISIVAATWTFIFVVNKIKEAIDEFTEDKNVGGIVAALLPIVGVIVAMILVFKTAAKIGNSGGLLALAGAMAGLSASVLLMTFALDAMIDFLQNTPAEDAIAAILSVIAIMGAIALLGGFMMRVAGKGLAGIQRSSSAVAMSLSIVTVTLTTALIVIPLLENMVQNSDRFPEYMQALGIFALTMISISASFALMTSRTKGGFHMLAAGIVFRAFVGTLKNVVMPMLQELQGLNVGEYLGGIAALTLLTLGISVGIEHLMYGVARLVEAISQINWKSWLAIILSTGTVIAGIMLLASYLENTETEISVGVIVASIATTTAIILAFGLFASMLTRTTRGNANTIGELAKVFKWMTLLITSIIVGLTGTMALLKLLYEGEEMEALGRIGIFAGIVLGTIGLTLLMFGIFIKRISNKLSLIPDSNLRNIKNILIVIFASMVGIISVLILYSIALDSAFHRWEEYAAPMATIIVSMLVAIGGVLAEIALFLNFLPTLEFNKSAVTIVIAALVAVLLYIITIGTTLIPAFKQLHDVKWEVILSLLTGLGILIFSITLLVVAASKAGGWENVLSVLLVCVTIMAAIAVLLPGIAKAFELFRGVGWTEFAILMLSFLVPFGALVAIIVVLKDIAPQFAAAAGNIALGIVEISIAVLALGAAIALVIGLIKEMINPGSTLIGQLLMDGEAEGIKKGAHHVYKANEETQNKLQEMTEKKHGIESPSKVYKNYGKMIDKGLAQGITKNEKVAIKAAEGLAVVTNEGFCEELGIQSPSKVFYENGRFVVRGFINGVNSESNKNKQAGLDMADGFSEGMDQAMENIKDDWKGLWTDSGMEADIDEAMKTMAENAGGIFSGTIFDKLMGTEEEVKAALSADETRELDRLRKEQKKYEELISDDKYVSEFNRTWTGPHDESYNAALKQYKDKITKQYNNINEQIAKFEGKTNKKKNTGLSGLFSGSFGTALDNLLGDSTIKEKLSEVGSFVGGGIMSIFDPTSTEGSKFSSTASGWFNNMLVDIGLKSESGSAEAGKKAGDNIGGNIVSEMVNKFTNDGEITSKLRSIGSQIGDAVGNSLYNALTGWVSDALDWLSGTTKERNIKKANDETLKAYMDTYGISDEHFVSLMNLAMADNKDIILDASNVDEIYKQYKKYKDQNTYVSKINLKNLGGWLTSFLGMPQQYEYSDFEMTTSGGYVRDSSKDKPINKQNLKDVLKRVYGLEYSEEDLNLIFEEALTRNVIDDYGFLKGTNSFNNKKSEVGATKTFIEWITSDYFNALLKGREMTNSEAYNQIRSLYGLAVDYGDNNPLKEIFNVIDYTKSMKNYELSGYEILKMVIVGMEEGWLENKDGFLKITGLTMDAFVEKIMEKLRISSPSKVAISIMDYFMQGGVIGIEDGIPDLLNAVNDMTGLMTDETVAGLNAMADAVNDDAIQPTITPVFDDSSIQNGVSNFNRSFDGLNTSVQATVDSFTNDSINYSSKFDMLSNNILSTNAILQSLCDTLQEGGIIDVNVNSEVNTDGLFDLVINKGKEKWRQTGKQQFKW